MNRQYSSIINLGELVKNIEKVLGRIFKLLDAYEILALAGIIGPLILLALDIDAAISDPKYSLIRDSISYLGLTSLGMLQTIVFVVLGLLVAIFTAGLFLNIRRRHLFDLGIVLLAFFAFGLVLIGIFRTDQIGAVSSVTGKIHVLAAYSVLGLFPVALALMLSSIKDDPRWYGMFRYTVVVGVLTFVLAIGRLFLPSQITWFGLYERVLVGNVVTWLEVAGIWLLILERRRRREAQKTNHIST